MYFKKILVSLLLLGFLNIHGESELPSLLASPKQINPIEQQLLEKKKAASVPKVLETNQVFSVQETMLDNEGIVQKLVDNAIKKNNVEQLNVYLKEGLIDIETMYECLKKMVEYKGPKVLDTFEEFFTFCKNNKITIEDTIDPKILDVVFDWSLRARNLETFKHAMEVSTEISQTTLNKLIQKIDENCNSPFKNLSNRKSACKEYNTLIKLIMDATK